MNSDDLKEKLGRIKNEITFLQEERDITIAEIKNALREELINDIVVVELHNRDSDFEYESIEDYKYLATLKENNFIPHNSYIDESTYHLIFVFETEDIIDEEDLAFKFGIGATEAEAIKELLSELVWV